MSVVEVPDGALISKDPDDTPVYLFNWDDNLATGVQLSSASFIVTALYPSASDATLTTSTTSPLGIQAGGRTVKVQMLVGTRGQRYRVTCRGATNETPSQTKDKSIEVLVEDH